MSAAPMFESPTEVADVVARLRDGFCGHFDDAVGLRSYIDEHLVVFRDGSCAMHRWRGHFCAIGNLAIRAIGATWEVGEFCKLLTAKHVAYGSVSLRRWGLIGVIIKIDQKVERILNMQAQDQIADAYDESILDSYQDIVGYCVLGFLLSKELQK